ncbi:MAG: FecR domain-containing protein [Pyrinomonadaceae bacterium]|nr:FecR domain-containing protein [Pyrinomonadaceae bacterium]
MKHYKEKLSAYLHHELPKEERQMIAEHLLQCEFCRKEHDEIKFGVVLASKLEAFDAPNNIWNEITENLDGKSAPTFSFVHQNSFFNRRGWFSLATSSLIVFVAILGLLKFNLFERPPMDIVQNNPQSTSNRTPNNSETVAPKASPFSTNGWEVETIAGTPLKNVLAVGETLETGTDSRALITVADIGNVEVSPNSRVKLVTSEQTERRLSLEKGALQATILAPPRLFIVDTPSAVAVDLGCSYRLEVDEDGNSKLRVTSGFVSLERDGHESIVPAGGMAITKKGKGIGTPYYEDASAQFQKALYSFDFSNGTSKSLKIILNEAREKDALTLWHLLWRTNGKDREQVFETLNGLVKLPECCTKEGILKLDKKMMETWQREIGIAWY